MSAPDGLPPLREVIARHALAAKKALGQNFLLDLNLTSRIARAGGSVEGATIVEVGPGPGGLTRALLLEGAARVVAIERDARCLPALAEIEAHYPGRLEVIEGDALAMDPGALAGGPFRIVSNLPYNVGTELLVRWLTPPAWPPSWESLTLMFQREVAERIVARAGTKAFGRLSVLAQWRAAPEIRFDVNPSAFTPPPKVTSSVVHLRPTEAPEGVDAGRLAGLTAAAFGQRRKMLRQSLKQALPVPEETLARAGIAPTSRAETLDIAEWMTLARAAGTGPAG